MTPNLIRINNPSAHEICALPSLLLKSLVYNMQPNYLRIANDFNY